MVLLNMVWQNKYLLSIHEALDFINSYFKKFPEIRDFMNEQYKSCRKNGYVKTLFGRRIHFRGHQ